jgi:hypothetical protein
MQSMKFDLEFEDKLICSTHRSGRKYGLGKECYFEGHGLTDKNESKGNWCQIKPKQQFISRESI